MRVIDIQQPHMLGLQACRTRVEAVAREVFAQFHLGEPVWSGNTLPFSGSGIEGWLQAGADNVHVHVRLGTLLGLLQAKIEAEIRAKLRAHLA